MPELESQKHFEILFRDLNTEPQSIRESDRIFIVYFTANWCKPCEKLDKLLITEECKKKGIPIYVCRAEVNDYTAGFCNVRSFPSFSVFRNPGKQLSTITTSSTEKVLAWITEL